MTTEQLNTINDLFQENMRNCIDFATDSYCEFKTFRNELMEQDNNIVVVTTTIKELNDNYIPVTQTKNFLVEPNGNFYEMDMLKDVFKDETEILSYIQTLKKFNWNEK